MLNARAPLRRPLIVADPEPLTIPAMIAAMRRGAWRRPGSFPVPPRCCTRHCMSLGQRETYELLAGSLVARTARRSRALGWAPRTTTPEGLARLMGDGSTSLTLTPCGGRADRPAPTSWRRCGHRAPHHRRAGTPFLAGRERHGAGDGDRDERSASTGGAAQVRPCGSCLAGEMSASAAAAAANMPSVTRVACTASTPRPTPGNT